MSYLPEQNRYKEMSYNRCGKSGLKLPAISLGLWHNFGYADNFDNAGNMIKEAFNCGITHFDLANNYGPPPGSAEENFGRILKNDFHGYRDEMIISTKAGYTMWQGPYGDWGSKKYLVASLDQSLKRMNLDYVDIFYHHRPDPDTPLEETIAALDLIVRQGKALYVGISNYTHLEAKKASDLFKRTGTPCTIHQPSYSMFNRWIENGLLDTLDEEGIGCIVFSPLHKGILTNRYLNGIPADSRASGHSVFLRKEDITKAIIDKVKRLNEVASNRGQSMAQMALSWTLRDSRITSALIGASKPEQMQECIKALNQPDFTAEELKIIEKILNQQDTTETLMGVRI